MITCVCFFLGKRAAGVLVSFLLYPKRPVPMRSFSTRPFLLLVFAWFDSKHDFEPFFSLAKTKVAHTLHNLDFYFFHHVK